MLLLLWALTAAQPRMLWSVGVRHEFRARAATAGEATPGSVVYDFDTLPYGGLMLLTRRVEFALKYTPTLTLRNLEAPTPSLLNAGELHLGVTASPRVLVVLNETASFGMTDYTSIAGLRGTTQRLSTVPGGIPRLFTAASYTELRGSFRLTAVSTLVASGHYMLSGGAYAADQMTLPQQQGPGADLDFRHRVSPLQEFGAYAGIVDRWFSSGPAFLIPRMGGTWSMVLRGPSRWLASVGGALIWPKNAYVLPMPDLRFSYDTHTKTLAFRLMLAMAPYVDGVYATVYERVESGFEFGWVPLSSLLIRAEGQWAVAVADPVYGGQQTAFLQAAVTRPFTTWFALDFGTRVYFSNLNNVTVWQWQLFVGFVMQSEKLTPERRERPR